MALVSDHTVSETGTSLNTCTETTTECRTLRQTRERNLKETKTIRGYCDWSAPEGSGSGVVISNIDRECFTV